MCYEIRHFHTTYILDLNVDFEKKQLKIIAKFYFFRFEKNY